MIYNLETYIYNIILISAMTEVVYVIQNHPVSHKRFVRFSQPKSFNIFRIFDEYERLHAFRSRAIYNIGVRVVSDYTISSDTTRPLMF